MLHLNLIEATHVDLCPHAPKVATYTGRQESSVGVAGMYRLLVRRKGLTVFTWLRTD